MALPKAVAEQNELADKLISQVKEAKQGKAESGTPRHPDPQAAPAQNDSQEGPKAPALQTGDDPGTWEQRYRTLQGMMKAATEENRELKLQLNQSGQEIVSLKAEVQALASKAGGPQQEITKEDLRSQLTEEEMDMLGEDLAGVVVKLANSVAKQQVQEIRTELSARSKEDEQKQDQKFKDKLNKAVPDFDVLNRTASFIEWTNQMEGSTGYQRKVFMQQAWDDRDVDTLAMYCNAFKEQGGAGPNPSLTPHGGGSPSDFGYSGDGQKRTFSAAEVQAFYENVRAGRIKGEEAQRREHEITVAAAEGRVIG